MRFLIVVEESQWSDTLAPFWHAQVHPLCLFVRFPNPVALSEWAGEPVFVLHTCSHRMHPYWHSMHSQSTHSSHYWIRIRLHRNALQGESVQNWPCHLSELSSFRPSMLYLARLISKGFNILCMTIFWINCREQLLCALHNDADFCNQSQTHYKGEYLPLSMQMPS